ncbi:hypothetical protein F5Y12DRAFT_609170 [Xylaria sp. FL1777]|nr:hypothetical protein F5Y12DRAFT_609170 [Xylaria sp. FL1777]
MAEPTNPNANPTARPRILYSDVGPEPPFPLRMEGAVISGFGRGSKELGIPTANLPVDAAATPWIADARSGVYFGWASLALPTNHPDSATATAAAAAAATAGAADTDAANINNHNGTNNVSSSSSSTEPKTEETSDSQAATTATTASRFQIYPMVMSIGYNPFYKNSVRSAEVHVLRSFGADFYDAPMRLLILGFVRDEKDYSGLDALVEDIRIDCDVARQSLAREAWTPVEGVVDGSKGTLDGSWLVR